MSCLFHLLNFKHFKRRPEYYIHIVLNIFETINNSQNENWFFDYSQSYAISYAMFILYECLTCCQRLWVTTAVQLSITKSLMMPHYAVWSVWFDLWKCRKLGCLWSSDFQGLFILWFHLKPAFLFTAMNTVSRSVELSYYMHGCHRPISGRYYKLSTAVF